MKRELIKFRYRNILEKMKRRYRGSEAPLHVTVESRDALQPRILAEQFAATLN